ncbi:MAG: hydantoinase/oxoprolinase family protein [Desulfobacteraceae bacterium]|jgi:N-methylhydantoinase A
MIIIGVDTGGTFTDFVFKEDGQWGVYKLLSTPSNPADAIIEGLIHIADGKFKKIVHGSTVATNAILERKGAKTALVTNKGFEDIIEIGRQNRGRLYDQAYRKEPAIISSEYRFGIPGRILNNGEEHTPLGLENVEKIAGKLKESQVESVAVCLLYSYVNPSHEQQIKARLEHLGIPVSLSHEILSEFREYERTSTTVINAYVSPKMQNYIDVLITHMNKGDHLGIMQSNGGSISADTAIKESVRTILSGPAGGAAGAFELGKMAGYSKIITFDMGGTSTDVSLMDGRLSLTTESKISGFPVRVPMIDIHTVGAGGGSIASIDTGGALKVGPESAGADPGPICYGKGDRITVTDANLYLGRIIPEHFLGGNMRPDKDRLEAPFNLHAKEAGLSAMELAEGILSVANTAMEKAIRVISVERGFNPGDFTLLSFGGAGGMHAAFLARLLNIPKILVPANPGTLSAMGMLMADIIKDYSLTIMKNQLDTTHEGLLEFFKGLEQKGVKDLDEEGVSKDSVFLERYLDMRYQGQSFEIIVPFTDTYIQDFHLLHEKNYGYRNREKTVEIVNIRLRARSIPEKPNFTKAEKTIERPSKDAFLGTRQVVFDQEQIDTGIIDRKKLLSGNRLEGPCVVVEYSSTIVIPPFTSALVDEYGNLVMEISE